MIEISERITRVSTGSDPISPLWPEVAGRSQLANGARAPTGARVTLEFTRSAALSPGQKVRLRYDFTGNGHFANCVGIPQATHIVARRGHVVVFHYRLSHWIASRDMHALRIPTARPPGTVFEAPAVDPSPA
jgi:hypothetical protein